MGIRELNGMELECCFCSQGVRAGIVNPCNLSILTNIDKLSDRQDNQLFFCHVECFKIALHDDIKERLVLKQLTFE